MKVQFRVLATTMEQALQEFSTHDGPWLAGAIAYYAAFSVFPLLLVLIAGLGLLLRFSPGAQTAQDQFLALVARATVPALASQLAAVLATVKLQAAFAGIPGLVALLVGATGLFAAIDGAFDRLWDVPAPAPGILPAARMLLTQRLVAFVMLLALAGLLVAAFVGSLILTATGTVVTRLPMGTLSWQIVQELANVIVSGLVLAAIYKILPKPVIRWRDVWFGAALVAIVWEIGKLLLAWLVIGQNYTAYGVVGAFIALMAWIYYASLLFFLGAEIVRVACRTYEEQTRAASTAGARPYGDGKTGSYVGPPAQHERPRGAMTSIFDMVKKTVREWSEDKAARLAAALAYYTVFSIAPLLIVVIGVAGLVFGRQAVQGQIVGQIRGLVGDQSASLIQDMIRGASKPSSGIIATVVGLVMLLLGASGVFNQLQESLNTIWEVMPRPGKSIWETIGNRILTFGMVLAIGFLLMVSLAISAALSAANGVLDRYLAGVPAFSQGANQLISLGVITLLFAMIFKYLPDVKISWRDVWAGALVTAVLFTIGKYLLGLYLGRASVSSAYGAAGSLVVILLWVYYSAQILFLGAEFTQVYARRYGSLIEPARGAIALTEQARAEQGMPHKQPAVQGAVAALGTGQLPSPEPPPVEASRESTALPVGYPSRSHIFASEMPAGPGPSRRARLLATTAAGAALFAVLAATRLGRRP